MSQTGDSGRKGERRRKMMEGMRETRGSRWTGIIKEAAKPYLNTSSNKIMTCIRDGMGDNTEMDEFLGNSQTAFDPPFPLFSKNYIVDFFFNFILKKPC